MSRITLNIALFHVIFFTVIYSSLTGNQDSLQGFRGIPWKSSPEFVRENESARYLQSFIGFGTYALSFRGRFAGYTMRIDYSFQDNKLIEGGYILDEPDDIIISFNTIERELTKKFGLPDYWANSRIGSGNIWIKVNEFGKYNGPQLYWEFSNGFIALHAGRFKDKITITVLFVTGKRISQYNTNRLMPPDG